MNDKGALFGLKVLDLTRVLAGPYCTMLLADMGAEVIKIEIPGKGDDSRAFGPLLKGESGYYMNMNRNKKGVTLNLKAGGKEIFQRMVKNANVVVENYRPGVMERLGLGYEDLKKINPGIVYAAISGFGHTGLYTHRPGYDAIGQAMSGLMSTTGWPGGEPTRIGTAMADSLAGLNATIGILAALRYKDQTGKGQKIDIALMDSGIANMQILHPIYNIDKQIPTRIGNRYESNYPTDSFHAKDRSIMISAANDKLWQNLCKAMGQPETAYLPEFKLNIDRVKNNKKVKKIIDAWVAMKTADEVVDELLAVGVPVAPINDIEQVVNDPHVAEREMFVDIKHPVAGMTKLTGNPIKLSLTKPKIKSPSPLLGQHNEEVFKTLAGLSDEEYERLKEQNVF